MLISVLKLAFHISEVGCIAAQWVNMLLNILGNKALSDETAFIRTLYSET
jgi:hypothetical protein